MSTDASAPGRPSRRLAVIGEPIAHSRSPAIHTAAFAALGMAEEWSYEAIEAPPEGFAELIRALAGKGFVGANVTVPHKRAALALADDASPAAREIGAANTLSFTGDTIRAENTDAPAFVESLPEPPAGRRALVLGAGGSARAVVWALAKVGARVEIWNRTTEKARVLAKEFGASVIEPVNLQLSAVNFDLIVNATTVGMESAHARGTPGADLKALHLAADGFHDRQVVVDLVYGSADTELVRTARERGATVIDGLEVLVRQGAASFRIWTGIDPPIDVMRRAARE